MGDRAKQVFGLKMEGFTQLDEKDGGEDIRVNKVMEG